MTRVLPCPACRKKVSAEASACPKCGHPLATDTKFLARGARRTNGFAWIIAVLALSCVGLPFLASSQGSAPEPVPPNDAGHPKAEQITDAMILAAIQGSDDLSMHKEAFINATRLFLSKGGTLADLRDIGGWVRSQRHKPRRVYFTYKQPGNARNRWYYDVDSGKLFQ